MTTRDRKKLLQTLCGKSRGTSSDPFADIAWPEQLDPDGWCMSPELISLSGTEFYASLTESERRRLSFLEAVNFFSLNIHGERLLIQGLASHLYEASDPRVSEYLHHFLDEENVHMSVFARFCLRYNGSIYSERHVALPRAWGPAQETFLFFARVLVFEEIVDHYNRAMASDIRLVPLAREINRLHHLDETRHLAFGRVIVAEMFERHAPEWSAETFAAVRKHLEDFIGASYREYFNPDVYRDAGFPEPYALRRLALQSPAARQRAADAAHRCVRQLTDIGVFPLEVRHAS